MEPKLGRIPKLQALQGGPTAPLPVTPAGEATGGGGEGGRQVNATGVGSREAGERALHPPTLLNDAQPCHCLDH
jgi:hypothetical protein